MSRDILIDIGGVGEPRLKPENKGCFGSPPDHQAAHLVGRLSEVQQTKFANKRKFAQTTE